MNLFNLPSCIAGIFGRMIPLQGVRLTQSLSQFHGVLAVRPIKKETTILTSWLMWHVAPWNWWEASRGRTWPPSFGQLGVRKTKIKQHTTHIGSFFLKDTSSVVFEHTRYLYCNRISKIEAMRIHFCVYLMGEFCSRNDCYVSNPTNVPQRPLLPSVTRTADGLLAFSAFKCVWRVVVESRKI